MTKKEILPLALLIIAVSLTVYFYPTLPAKIATHFDAQGRADAWSPKLSGLLQYLIIMLIAYLTLTFYSKLPFKTVRLASFRPKFPHTESKIYLKLQGIRSFLNFKLLGTHREDQKLAFATVSFG